MRLLFIHSHLLKNELFDKSKAAERKSLESRKCFQLVFESSKLPATHTRARSTHFSLFFSVSSDRCQVFVQSRRHRRVVKTWIRDRGECKKRIKIEKNAKSVMWIERKFKTVFMFWLTFFGEWKRSGWKLNESNRAGERRWNWIGIERIFVFCAAFG